MNNIPTIIVNDEVLQNNRSKDVFEKELQHHYEVVIIGAGISGVGAANQILKRAVKNFCLLEAQNNGGGRIHSIGNQEDGFLELGAQWIHGEAPENAIHLAIHEFDLVDTGITEIDGGGDFFSEFGEKLTDDRKLINALEWFEEMNETIHVENFYPCKNSVEEYFHSKFKECIKNVKNVMDINMYNSYFNWMMRWERVDNACHSMKNISAIGWQDYKFCSGKRNMPPKKGMISVFSEISRNVSKHIHLNTEVVKIVINDSYGTNNEDILNQAPITIYCKNGITYQCNHVIVTCSIGFLKQNLKMFSPPLPTKLEKAIRNHGYGNIGKIFLEFDSKWWDWKDGQIQIVWTDDKTKFNETTMNRNSWIKAVCGFNEAYGRKNTIVAWIGGEECAEMESTPMNEVAIVLVQLLIQFTGNTCIPTPINVYRSEFSMNKFFNGGYSHPLPANDKEKIIDTLNFPVYGNLSSNSLKMPLIVFAGEANSKNFYSTMHGAFESGNEQAKIYCDWRDRYL